MIRNASDGKFSTIDLNCTSWKSVRKSEMYNRIFHLRFEYYPTSRFLKLHKSPNLSLYPTQKQWYQSILSPKKKFCFFRFQIISSALKSSKRNVKNLFFSVLEVSRENDSLTRRPLPAAAGETRFCAVRRARARPGGRSVRPSQLVSWEL